MPDPSAFMTGNAPQGGASYSAPLVGFLAGDRLAKLPKEYYAARMRAPVIDPRTGQPTMLLLPCKCRQISILREIMRNTKAPAAPRVSAADAILDRGHGKPPVTIDANNTNVNEDSLPSWRNGASRPNAVDYFPTPLWAPGAIWQSRWSAERRIRHSRVSALLRG